MTFKPTKKKKDKKNEEPTTLGPTRAPKTSKPTKKKDKKSNLRQTNKGATILTICWID